jgi:hypothetical protein
MLVGMATKKFLRLNANHSGKFSAAEITKEGVVIPFVIDSNLFFNEGHRRWNHLMD